MFVNIFKFQTFDCLTFESFGHLTLSKISFWNAFLKTSDQIRNEFWIGFHVRSKVFLFQIVDSSRFPFINTFRTKSTSACSLTQTHESALSLSLSLVNLNSNLFYGSLFASERFPTFQMCFAFFSPRWFAVADKTNSRQISFFTYSNTFSLRCYLFWSLTFQYQAFCACLPFL